MDSITAALSERPMLSSFLGVLAALKVYFKLTTGRCDSSRRLDGMTAIVTGGNSGIGKETARDLARRGARVILACRNIPKAEAARECIIRTTGNSNVEVRSLDLSSFASVRQFAQRILETESGVHILVNNAGMPGSPGKRSRDGIDLTVQINHLGHLLLTVLLLDLLKRSAPSRIVFVSSLMHYGARLDPDDLCHEKMHKYSPVVAYSNTKLCNILTANHLAARLRNTGVTVNSLHPGVVMTEIWDRVPKVLSTVSKFVLSFCSKTAEEGAQTTIYLAVSESVEGVTGQYFSDCKAVAPSKAAQDENLARVVWERSCELVGLSATQSRL